MRLRIGWLLLAALLPASLCADDDDDRRAAPGQSQEQPALSPEQLGAVGIITAHPRPLPAAREIEAYAQVLDPAALAADAGRLASSRAAARAAAAEVQRLDGLYRNDANASLKSLQAAQAAQAETQAQAQAAAAAFTVQWGPLAKLPEARLQALIASCADGGTLLLRAVLPGRSSLDAAPSRAVLEIDQATVPARVLGILAGTAAEAQSAGVLLQADHAPQGLGPGARVAARLQTPAGGGLLLPAAALVYGEQGPYVYRQQAAAPGGALRYAAAPVKLLQPLGDSWLVQGVDADDMVVVHGAGVLWSLQGLGSFSAEEEDHD